MFNSAVNIELFDSSILLLTRAIYSPGLLKLHSPPVDGHRPYPRRDIGVCPLRNWVWYGCANTRAASVPKRGASAAAAFPAPELSETIKMSMVSEGLGITGQLAKVAWRCVFCLGLDADGAEYRS